MTEHKDNNINPDTTKIETLNGTIENSNDYILNNIGAYLEYIREIIRGIIQNEGLQYAEPMDKKKIYPAFNYIQFQYLLSRVYDLVFAVNLELLHPPNYNKYNKLYDHNKVKLCYTVYQKLCAYYGFICSVEGFYIFSGIEERTLKEWLSSGVNDLFKIMSENAKNTVISSFENSPVPLLKLAAGNYKYKLNEARPDHTPAGIIDSLPDLLSLPDAQKALAGKKPD